MIGTLIAHRLFWHTNTVGIFSVEAKFIDSWKSPSLVAPSPKYAADTVFSPRSFAAHAIPTACSMCVPIGIDNGRMFTPSGIWFPRSSPIQCSSTYSIARPCQNSAAFSR